MLVGTERLRTMVLTCSLVEYVGHRVASEDIQSFWQHCFLTAALSERLARAIAYPQPEQAYLAGLLHDIGALPLLMVTSAESQEPENMATCGWGESVELEREHFGTDHCEVGHWIGVSWNFSPDLAGSHGEVIISPGKPRKIRTWWAWWLRRTSSAVRRGIVLGAVPPELSEPSRQSGSGHPPGLPAAVEAGGGG